MQQTLSETF